MKSKRQQQVRAQQILARVVEMILPEERLSGVKLLRSSTDERLDTTN